MSAIQEQFDRCTAQTFVLSPGEYEGPLRVSRPCTVDGACSTLWIASGPALVVDSPGVRLKNLRVEVTQGGGGPQAGTAIVTRDPDTQLENIEVSGALQGFRGESEAWSLPSVIDLGVFAPEEHNSFVVELTAPAPARLQNKLRDVTVTPDRLVPGRNLVTIRTQEMRDNTILYGELQVCTGVLRRIYLHGRSAAGGALHTEAAPAHSVLPGQSEQLLPPEELLAPVVSQDGIPSLRRGARVALGPVEGCTLKVALEHKGLRRAVDIDGYLFCLGRDGRVRRDEDLIFFGNPGSRDGAVRMTDSGGIPLALIEPDKLEPGVERLSVCFSIYGDDPSENFSLVESPLVRVFRGDRELYRFQAEDLRLEKTIVAVELYRYKGTWKLSCVGAGYHSGLRTLCESFGVHIE